MNLAFVHPTYPDSEGTGASHSASRIVFEVADRGHDVTVYCWETPPDDVDRRPEDGVTLEPLDTAGYPYHSALQLDAALRDRAAEFDRYDLVHSYVMNSLPALGEIAETSDTATVLTLNAYGAVCPKNDLRYMDREPCTSNGLAKCTACSIATSGGHDDDGRLYRSASRLGYLKLIRAGERVADRIDAYHALSPHVRSTYAEFGFPQERLRVVPNVLDERFDRDHESDFESPYELLSVGSLDRHKGVDLLVPILDRIRRRSDADVRLTVVGDGGLRTALKSQASDAGLDEAVTVTGWVDNDALPEIYATHDCFVYPGRWDEPFGRVFLEALATGTPVVASDVGSVGDIVGGGGKIVSDGGGTVGDSGNSAGGGADTGGGDSNGGDTTDGAVAAFAETILGTIRRDELPTLSANARRRVADYRPDTVVPQFLALYEDAIEW